MKYKIFKKKLNKIIKRNRIFIIIFVIAFILLIGLFICYNYKDKLFEKEIIERELFAPPEEELKEPKINGYIVELYEKPLLVKETELKKSSPTRTASQSSMISHKQRLINEKENSKQEIKNLLGKSEIRKTSSTNSNSLHILSDYENVFNGFALNITPEEAEKIKNEANVKRVYPNYEVNITLMDSVPLINADDVWQLQDNLGRNITGKNITIAIIDTGIDYSHPDLGASVLEERDFDKITNTPLNLFLDYDFDQQIRMEDNQLIYYSGNKIYIYSFETNETIEIDAFSDDLEIIRLAKKDNFLAYFATNKNLNTSLYLYDLNMTSHKNIFSGAKRLGYIAISNGKVIHGTGIESNDWLISNIYVYDIETNQTTTIALNSTFAYFPIVSGYLVAYSVPTDYCYDKLVIYNISSGEERELTPPDVGPVFDFKDNEVLYLACSKTMFDPEWKTNYIYDINTGEYTELSYSPQEEINESETNIMMNYLVVTSRINKGAIGDGVVYFSKYVFSDIIIAYDRILDRYVQINAYNPSGYIDAEGKKVCFLSKDRNVYCHDYNSSADYPIPQIVFNSKVVGGYDFVNNDEDFMDDYGHGTHVAATAAGNGILKGVAPDAQLYGYKVLNSGGSGWGSDIIAAIERAADPNQDGNFSDHLDVISMSLGGWGNPDDPMSTAVDNIVDAGVVAVIAAGNYGEENTIGSPGTSRKAITIGATDKYDNIAYFSSRGPIIWQDYQGNTKYLLKPDVVAPGVDICAAQWNGWLDDEHCLDTEHIAIQGTSMATPHVAGAIALIKQAHPDWNPEEIKMALRNTAIDINENINVQGYGRIDVLEAVSLDNRPPIAQLDVPVVSGNILDITGTATAENIQDYRLYSGNGIEPIIFEEFYVSSTPVENGILLEGFDSNSLFEGINTIKLAVTSFENITSEDRILIEVDKVQLTNPPNEVFRLGDIIEIKGTIQGNFNDLIVDYGIGEEPSEWFIDGITLNQAPEIINDTIATLDTSLMTSTDYTLRLTVNYPNEEVIEYRNIFVYSDLKEGWPVELGGRSIQSSPVIADINNDGKSELIVSARDCVWNQEVEWGECVSGEQTQFIYVFTEDGELVEGWPVELQNARYQIGGRSIDPDITIADFENDGFLEIIYSWGEIYVLDYTGNFKNRDGWPAECPGDYKVSFETPTIADLENDSNLDIIVSCSESLVVYHEDGSIASGWPFATDNWIASSPAVADLDMDGDLEIIFNSYDHNIYVLHHTGELMEGWPINTDTSFISSPAIGDLDNDNDLEIIVGGLRDLFAFHHNGTIMEGWPYSYTTFWDGFDVSSPALGDINNDGYLEVLAATRTENQLFAIDYQGNLINGWPVIVGVQPADSTNDIHSSPIIVNIDEDPYLEVFIGSGINDNRIYAFNHDGSPVEGWPKMTGDEIVSTPLVGDLDSDDKLEIIVTSTDSKIYVYETEAQTDSSALVWPMFQHDRRHTGNYYFEEPNICTDSDITQDHLDGKNYYLQGTVVSEETPDGETDTCTDNNTLVEYFCGTDQTTADEIYTCPEGCENGACISPVSPICGNNIIEGDEVCDYDNIDNKTCSDFNYTEGYISCCSNCSRFDLSNCVDVTYKCKDYDNGTNYYNASFISYYISLDYGSDCNGISTGTEGGGKLFDTCINDYVLIEQTCGEDGTPTKINYTCPLGCADNACIPGCGDGMKNLNESCDTNDFNGLSCSDYGKNAGTLSCTNNCTTIDTSGCYTTTTDNGGGGGGGGGGGRDSGRTSYTLGSITSPIPLKVGRKDKASFKIGEEKHNMEITQVKRDYIEIKISSESMTVLIYKGETKKIDLNNDGILDLFITVQNIKSGKADITIDVIQPQAVCNNNYVCELGENLLNCPNDCKQEVDVKLIDEASQYIEQIICDYNEICDNDETPLTCPTDCKRSFKDSIIVSLITLLAMALIIGFFVVEHKHHEVYYVPRKIKKHIIPLLISDTSLSKIKNYLIFKRFKKKDIKDTLKYAHNFNILKDYVIKCKDKGHNLENIKTVLRKNKWPTTLINDVLNNIKKRDKK